MGQTRQSMSGTTFPMCTQQQTWAPNPFAADPATAKNKNDMF